MKRDSVGRKVPGNVSENVSEKVSENISAQEPAARYLVPALQRGLQLLGEFKRSDRELTGAELSRRMDLPRASVFRLLQTLELMGFVERVGDSANYKLGIAVLRLGFEFLASMELTEPVRPPGGARRARGGVCGQGGRPRHAVQFDPGRCPAARPRHRAGARAAGQSDNGRLESAVCGQDAARFHAADAHHAGHSQGHDCARRSARLRHQPGRV